MGTPDFTVPVLTALTDTHQVVGVVTQPDRRSGRGRQQLELPPAKRATLAHNHPLIQPRSLRSPEAMAQLLEWRPEVIVVAAFGQILSQKALDIPLCGCLNIHASPLPRWRGAAPVSAAILAGDTITGVTIMRMDAGLDTGPILAQQEEPIRPDDTRETLTKRLFRLGARLLVETLPEYLIGRLQLRPQPDRGVTYARQLRKEDGLIDWSRSAVELDQQVRALYPWPCAFTTLHGKTLKLLQTVPLSDWRGGAPPGTVIAVADGVAVTTGEGALGLKEVQLAGKRRMDIEAFLCGQRECVGSQLGGG